MQLIGINRVSPREELKTLTPAIWSVYQMVMPVSLPLASWLFLQEAFQVEFHLTLFLSLPSLSTSLLQFIAT